MMLKGKKMTVILPPGILAPPAPPVLLRLLLLFCLIPFNCVKIRIMSPVGRDSTNFYCLQGDDARQIWEVLRGSQKKWNPNHLTSF